MSRRTQKDLRLYCERINNILTMLKANFTVDVSSTGNGSQDVVLVPYQGLRQRVVYRGSIPEVAIYFEGLIAGLTGFR